MKKLYRKYDIKKANGQPTDPKAKYFVLRLDTDPVARMAMRTYANEVERPEPEFAAQIRAWMDRLDDGDQEIEEEQAAITAEEYQDAVATDEEVEAEIKKYEQQFGMSSEEFLEQMRLGTAPDEAGIIDWMLLLKYR